MYMFMLLTKFSVQCDGSLYMACFASETTAHSVVSVSFGLMILPSSLVCPLQTASIFHRRQPLKISLLTAFLPPPKPSAKKPARRMIFPFEEGDAFHRQQPFPPSPTAPKKPTNRSRPHAAILPVAREFNARRSSSYSSSSCSIKYASFWRRQQQTKQYDVTSMKPTPIST